MNAKELLFWLSKIIILSILYIPIWILGSMAVSGHIPEALGDPGLVNEIAGMFILSFINTILIIGLIVSSRWHGWRLTLLLGLAFYGSFTFITQVETWYFLADLTVPPELLPRLFIMGLPTPFLFIPIAITICGRWKKKETSVNHPYMVMPTKQLFLKLGIISVLYVIIYWLAGYFIAWQNPELRAFYGSEGAIAPFGQHTLTTFSQDPGLIFLQLIRGLLFALIAAPVISGSMVSPRITALLVACLLAFPHLGHILSNPLIPEASVRMSHMIETTTSTFVFGLIIVWLLHRKHSGYKDLFAKNASVLKSTNIVI